ncbi:OLC1v1007936C1 [Oldenlandia corymbosa var. corymbosa]|uniref:OLC1v1007936C1 n=1 Tax=Oldenlandia corymbosa var. corymbosa TaxID=529605 RepID=A0AAV1DKY2_OLDCO|nr:OLC1v1007936C1 [Oldenlandia corymbosa var. corymbosa]
MRTLPSLQRLKRVGDRAKSKKATTDASTKEATAPGNETVPSATKTVQNPPPEAGPSVVPPAPENGKGPLDGEAITIPPQLFEGDKLGLDGLSGAAEEIARRRGRRGMATALEEMNLVATKCGAHRVGVAGLRRLDQDRPIKAKWFKLLLIKDPKKTMHEAMVKVLTRRRTRYLCQGPSEEDPIPDVPDEYMGIELEDADEATEEDVADTGHSGVQRNAEDASQNPPPGHDAVLLEEQSSEFPLYSMISGILRSRAGVHSIEIVRNLENDLLDAMRTHNVKVNQHLINKINGLREEMQCREAQSLKDYGDSLTFEPEIHDELVTLEKENARLRERQQITVSPWFLKEHQVLARVQHMNMT